MNNKRNNNKRPTTARGYLHDRSQRGRTVPAQGIYNNSFFMHAATSIVGNLAQVQTHSGSIYEGIYRAFSANFDVAIELAQCVKPNQNQTSDASSIANCMIFQPDHVVSIAAKNVDLDFATSGNFQTDSAISARFSGSREEKELEPWEPSGGSINGDIDLELDGNANGWDANEMFNKNEKLYGVQSTFDQSLAGYTVQIEKKDTLDFKEAEEKAEKIAQEIENQANYHERLDLENGDEEARFAAVERPPEQIQEISPRENTSINTSNTGSSMSKGTSNDKHVIPSKRKTMQSGKIRSTPPPNNNNGPIPQHSVHSSNKNNNYQPMQMQQGPPQYMLNPNYPHGMHGHTPSISQAKMNGDGSMNNSGKPLPQRGMRQYSSQGAPSGSYSDNQGIGGQMSMGKQQMHISQNHSHIIQHSNIQEAPPSGHIPVHSSMPSNVPPQQTQPPPQPQRQPRTRDEVQDLKKFHQDFNLVTTNQQQTQTSQVKTPSVSPHPAQTNLTPPQQIQQQLSPMQPPPQLQTQHTHSQPPQQTGHSQQQQQQQHSQHHMQQQTPPQIVQQQQDQQSDNVSVVSVQKAQQIQHQQDQQSYVAQPPPQQQQLQPPPQHTQQQQQQQPPTIIQPGNAGHSSLPQSTTPPQPTQQQQQQTQQTLNSSTSSNDTPQADKPASTVVKKTHVLNPSAKPFTPRSPSTPNPSRPHTPQTPGPAMTPNVYTAGPHMPPAQGQIYVMQPQGSFQTPPHGHVGRSRLGRPPVVGTSQLQVSAATGQPLLTTGTMHTPLFHYQQPPSHPSHYQSQPYQQMMRMYSEPPPQQIQFVTQTPPSTTPSPGQPHQQFHPGQQPSPAGNAPPAFGAAPQPFPVMCLAAAGPPHLVPNYYQGAQTPHGQQFPLILQSQHPTQ